jgi:hypothetical protein
MKLSRDVQTNEHGYYFAFTDSGSTFLHEFAFCRLVDGEPNIDLWSLKSENPMRAWSGVIGRLL